MGFGDSRSDGAWKFETNYFNKYNLKNHLKVNLYIILRYSYMPFYSRHSSDGRDRFLGDMRDEEEYDQFMNMIFISSSFTDEIQSHYDSSEADVLPPSSSEEEKIEKTRKYQKEQQPYMCRICGKTLSRQL